MPMKTADLVISKLSPVTLKVMYSAIDIKFSLKKTPASALLRLPQFESEGECVEVDWQFGLNQSGRLRPNSYQNDMFVIPEREEIEKLCQTSAIKTLPMKEEVLYQRNVLNYHKLEDIVELAKKRVKAERSEYEFFDPEFVTEFKDQGKFERSFDSAWKKIKKIENLDDLKMKKEGKEDIFTKFLKSRNELNHLIQEGFKSSAGPIINLRSRSSNVVNVRKNLYQKLLDFKKAIEADLTNPKNCLFYQFLYLLDEEDVAAHKDFETVLFNAKRKGEKLKEVSKEQHEKYKRITEDLCFRPLSYSAMKDYVRENDYIRSAKVNDLDVEEEYEGLSNQAARLKRAQNDEKEGKRKKKSVLMNTANITKACTVIEAVRRVLMEKSEKKDRDPFWDEVSQEIKINSEGLEKMMNFCTGEMKEAWNELKSSRLADLLDEVTYTYTSLHANSGRGQGFDMYPISSLDSDTVRIHYGEQFVEDEKGKALASLIRIKKEDFDDDMKIIVSNFWGGVSIVHGKEYVWVTQNIQRPHNNQVFETISTRSVVSFIYGGIMIDNLSPDRRKKKDLIRGIMKNDLIHSTICLLDPTFTTSSILDLSMKVRTAQINSHNNIAGLITTKITERITTAWHVYIVQSLLGWCQKISDQKHVGPTDIFTMEYLGLKEKSAGGERKRSKNASISILPWLTYLPITDIAGLQYDLQWTKLSFAESRSMKHHKSINFETIRAQGEIFQKELESENSRICGRQESMEKDLFDFTNEILGNSGEKKERGFVAELVYWVSKIQSQKMDQKKERVLEKIKTLWETPITQMLRTKASTMKDGKPGKQFSAVLEDLIEVPEGMEVKQVGTVISDLIQKWKESRHEYTVVRESDKKQRGSSREFYILPPEYFILNWYVESVMRELCDLNEVNNVIGSKDKTSLIANNIRDNLEIRTPGWESYEDFSIQDKNLQEKNLKRFWMASQDHSKWAPGDIVQKFVPFFYGLKEGGIINEHFQAVGLFNCLVRTFKVLVVPDRIFTTVRRQEKLIRECEDSIVRLKEEWANKKDAGTQVLIRQKIMARVSLSACLRENDDSHFKKRMDKEGRYKMPESWLNGMFQFASSFLIMCIVRFCQYKINGIWGDPINSEEKGPLINFYEQESKLSSFTKDNQKVIKDEINSGKWMMGRNSRNGKGKFFKRSLHSTVQENAPSEIFESQGRSSFLTFAVHSDDQYSLYFGTEEEAENMLLMETWIVKMCNFEKNRKKSHMGHLMEFLSELFLYRRTCKGFIKKLSDIRDTIPTEGFPSDMRARLGAVFDLFSSGMSYASMDWWARIAMSDCRRKHPRFAMYEHQNDDEGNEEEDLEEQKVAIRLPQYKRGVAVGGSVYPCSALMLSFGILESHFLILTHSMARDEEYYSGCYDYLVGLYGPEEYWLKESQTFNLPSLIVDKKILQIRESLPKKFKMTDEEKEEVEKYYKKFPAMQSKFSRSNDMVVMQMKERFFSVSFLKAYSHLSQQILQRRLLQPNIPWISTAAPKTEFREVREIDMERMETVTKKIAVTTPYVHTSELKQCYNEVTLFEGKKGLRIARDIANLVCKQTMGEGFSFLTEIEKIKKFELSQKSLKKEPVVSYARLKSYNPSNLITSKDVDDYFSESVVQQSMEPGTRIRVKEYVDSVCKQMGVKESDDRRIAYSIVKRVNSMDEGRGATITSSYRFDGKDTTFSEMISKIDFYSDLFMGIKDEFITVSGESINDKIVTQVALTLIETDKVRKRIDEMSDARLVSQAVIEINEVDIDALSNYALDPPGNVEVKAAFRFSNDFEEIKIEEAVSLAKSSAARSLVAQMIDVELRDSAKIKEWWIDDARMRSEADAFNGNLIGRVVSNGSDFICYGYLSKTREIVFASTSGASGMNIFEKTIGRLKTDRLRNSDARTGRVVGLKCVGRKLRRGQEFFGVQGEYLESSEVIAVENGQNGYGVTPSNSEEMLKSMRWPYGGRLIANIESKAMNFDNDVLVEASFKVNGFALKMDNSWAYNHRLDEKFREDFLLNVIHTLRFDVMRDKGPVSADLRRQLYSSKLSLMSRWMKGKKWTEVKNILETEKAFCESQLNDIQKSMEEDDFDSEDIKKAALYEERVEMLLELMSDGADSERGLQRDQMNLLEELGFFRRELRTSWYERSLVGMIILDIKKISTYMDPLKIDEELTRKEQEEEIFEDEGGEIDVSWL